jgi:chromosome segregation ATPase
MDLKIEQLQDKNLLLQRNINNLTGDNTVLQGNVGNLSNENLVLSNKVEELSTAVDNLQSSEKEIQDLVEKLTEQIHTRDEHDLKNQIEVLEKLHSDTHTEIGNLMERLMSLETSLKQPQTSGILTYIEIEEDQSIFIQKVEEALVQGMTYAQINKYLTKNLTSELDKIIKKHPALTKKFIRNLRKD